MLIEALRGTLVIFDFITSTNKRSQGGILVSWGGKHS